MISVMSECHYLKSRTAIIKLSVFLKIKVLALPSLIIIFN